MTKISDIEKTVMEKVEDSKIFSYVTSKIEHFNRRPLWQKILIGILVYLSVRWAWRKFNKDFSSAPTPAGNETWRA
jgi:hypothetical protein